MATKAVTLQHSKLVRLTDADQQGTCYVRQLPDAHFVHIDHTTNPGAGDYSNIANTEDMATYKRAFITVEL